MTKRMEIYKCEICGNIVELLHIGAGKLVCCNQEMKKMTEQTADFSIEKHVPVIKKTDKGIKVVVGSTLHPMKEEHFIEWIEIIDGNNIFRRNLKPGDEPVAEFDIKFNESLQAREYCNLHGLWKN